MDPLRISLIVIGALIVLVLYLLGRFQGQRQARQNRTAPAPVSDSSSNEAQPGYPGAETVVDEDLPSLSATRDEFSHEQTGSSAKESSHEVQPANAESLIAYFLLTPNPRPLAGTRILSAFGAAGLEYGDMEIFHYLDPGSGKPVFSTANMLKPGTFPISAMDNFESPGLVMFMQLPGPCDVLDSYDAFVNKAQTLATSLGAQLCDDRHQPLSQETIHRQREQLKARYN